MTNVLIKHLPNDPLGLRISMGGTYKRGYYCMFRGNQEDCIALIETILLVMKNMPPLAIEEETRLENN